MKKHNVITLQEYETRKQGRRQIATPDKKSLADTLARGKLRYILV